MQYDDPTPSSGGGWGKGNRVRVSVAYSLSEMVLCKGSEVNMTKY